MDESSSSSVARRRSLESAASGLSDEEEADKADEYAARYAEDSRLSSKIESGRWSMAEHKRFVEGLHKFGRRKWIRIAQHVGTRTVIQVRSHAQKYFKKLRKEEGGSDHEDHQVRPRFLPGAPLMQQQQQQQQPQQGVPAGFALFGAPVQAVPTAHWPPPVGGLHLLGLPQHQQHHHQSPPSLPQRQEHLRPGSPQPQQPQQPLHKKKKIPPGPAGGDAAAATADTGGLALLTAAASMIDDKRRRKTASPPPTSDDAATVKVDRDEHSLASDCDNSLSYQLVFPFVDALALQKQQHALATRRRDLAEPGESPLESRRQRQRHAEGLVF